MSVPAPQPAPPLAETQLAELDRLTNDLDARQLWWTSGYLAGLAGAARAAPAPAPAQGPVATVLYATQTGNSRRIAEALAARLSGHEVRLSSVADYRIADLANERQVLFVVSTHGEGEPPDEALPFFDRLESRRAPKLDGVRFAVLALGDSSYEQYCEIGRRLDERLAALGGERILPRVDCDVEFEDDARSWSQTLESSLDLGPPSNVVPMRGPDPAAVGVGRDHPLAAEVLEVQRITGQGSSSDTVHLELATPGLAYEPGDALGVWHRNPPSVVAALLAALDLDADAAVTLDGEGWSLGAALAERREITALSKPLLERYATASNDRALAARLAGASRVELVKLLGEWQLLDLVAAHPAPLAPQAVIDLLPALKPRLYSIASALAGEEVHLTVARAAWERGGERRLGAASNWLADFAIGGTLPVYVEPNASFRLPADPAAPILMIGAGTGVAPYRAFVEARAGQAGAGESWLIFGHRHFRTDFLYQAEWQRYLAAGDLARLDVAFSRDRGRDRYVQDVLRRHGKDVLELVAAGGHLYVCGSIAMGQGVDRALAALAAEIGEDGEAFVARLKEERRLHRDVY